MDEREEVWRQDGKEHKANMAREDHDKFCNGCGDCEDVTIYQCEYCDGSIKGREMDFIKHTENCLKEIEHGG